MEKLKEEVYPIFRMFSNGNNKQKRMEAKWHEES